MSRPIDVDPGGRRIELEGGYGVRTPGLRGTAAIHLPRQSGTRGLELATPDFDDALRAAGMTETRVIELDVSQTPPPSSAAEVRGPDGEDALELTVPDLGPETGQIVLSVDESGVLSWHMPVDDVNGIETPETRGAGAMKRFRIRRAVAPAPPPGDAEHRALVQAIGRKLLKVLVYPVTDPILGPVGRFFAGRFEEAKRPYGVRLFRPEDYGEKDVPALGSAEWGRLASGRVLLFLHGTFSTAHGAFGQIPAGVIADLNDRYEGRVMAFNHFTLSHDPHQNMRELLDRMPAETSLDVDIISHSRGGLVARTLAEKFPAAASEGRVVSVRRVLCVGVPNNGTSLAHADHMVEMLDRFTTVLNLIPSGPVAETLEAIVTVVKVIAHGALEGLGGLSAMNPQGSFLAELNGGGMVDTEYYAVTADFEPQMAGLAQFVKKTVADQVVDRVFEQDPNDLVVPTRGTYENASPNFPIPPERRLEFGSDQGVTHTNYFAQERTQRALLDWLA